MQIFRDLVKDLILHAEDLASSYSGRSGEEEEGQRERRESKGEGEKKKKKKRMN